MAGSEAKKREEYIIGEDGDIYFVIDADEVLFCGAEWLRRIERNPNFYPGEKAFNVVIWNKGLPNVLNQRIYRHPFSYLKNFPMAKVTVPIVIEHRKCKKMI